MKAYVTVLNLGLFFDLKTNFPHIPRRFPVIPRRFPGHSPQIPRSFPADSPVIPRRFPVIPRRFPGHSPQIPQSFPADSHSPFPFPIPIPRFPVPCFKDSPPTRIDAIMHSKFRSYFITPAYFTGSFYLTKIPTQTFDVQILIILLSFTRFFINYEFKTCIKQRSAVQLSAVQLQRQDFHKISYTVFTISKCTLEVIFS